MLQRTHPGRGDAVRADFRGYYRPTEAELEQLWTSGLIVLDTNVLLSLYEYSESTRSALMKLLSSNSARVWIPYQVAQEFQRNRLARISRGIEQRQEAADALKSLNQLLSKWFDPVEPAIGRSLEQVARFIESRIDRHRSTVGGEQGVADAIREDLDRILVDRIGSRPSVEWVAEAYVTAGERAASRVPPGYEDYKKSEGREAGDYFIWSQLLTHAASEAVPVIFVTEERKEDWWLQYKGLTIGPRPELIEEFWAAVRQPFWMYRTDSFLVAAKKYLDDQISEAAVSEVQLVSDRLMQEERQRKERVMQRVRARQRERATELAASHQDAENLARADMQLKHLALEHEKLTRLIAAHGAGFAVEDESDGLTSAELSARLDALHARRDVLESERAALLARLTARDHAMRVDRDLLREHDRQLRLQVDDSGAVSRREP